MIVTRFCCRLLLLDVAGTKITVKGPVGVTAIYPHVFINGSSQAESTAVTISQRGIGGGSNSSKGQCDPPISSHSKPKILLAIS